MVFKLVRVWIRLECLGFGFGLGHGPCKCLVFGLGLNVFMRIFGFGLKVVLENNDG